MRSAFLAALAAICSGCAMTPQELAATPTGSLCVRYAGAILNSNRGAWLEEVYRRGETCAPYANEMAIAARQAQASLDSLNSRYVNPAPKSTPPLLLQEAAQPAQRPSLIGYFQGSVVQGESRFCRYDVFGRTHIVTVKALQMCSPTVQVQQ